MNWRFSRNNRSSNFPYGDDIWNNDNNRNGRNQRGRNNRNRRPTSQYHDDGYTISEARYEYDMRVIPHSRTPYSYRHSEQESDRTLRGYRISGPYDDETRYMRGFRTYDPYPYDDHYSPGPSNFQPYLNQVRYDYHYSQHHQNVQYAPYDHRMGDHRFNELREPRFSEMRESRYSELRESRHLGHLPRDGRGNTYYNEFYHRHSEQPRASSSNQPSSSTPQMIFPHVNRTQITYPTKSSLRQPRDEQDKEKVKKKVTFKKRTTTRKISPEPEKKWCNLFRKKKKTLQERGPTPAEYLGASEEREWY